MPRIFIDFIKQWLFKKRNAAVCISAVLLGLASPAMGWGWLAWGALGVALYALNACQKGPQAFGQGMLLGGLYHAIITVWLLGLYPLSWMGFSKAGSVMLVISAWAFVILTQGIVWGLVWLAFYNLKQHSIWLLCLLGPLVWVVGLWFLNQHPVGLPWGFLAYSQMSHPWIRPCVYTWHMTGLEGLLVFANLAVFYGLVQKQYRIFAIFTLVFGIMLFVGWVYKPSQSNVFQTLQPVVVQGSIPIEIDRVFLKPNQRIAYYQSLIEEVFRREADTKLVILPEGTVYLSPGEKNNPLQLRQPVGLVAGGPFSEGDAVYNGAFLFDDTRLLYSVGKRVLVPFGETTPFISEAMVSDFLAHWHVRYSKGFSPASMQQPPIPFQGFKVGTLICFEVLYPTITWKYRQEKVDLLITLSDLAWFHQHPFLERQFLAMSQMRAAEAGVPLVLAANTGISAFISETGDILARTDSGLVQQLTPRGKRALNPNKAFLLPEG